MASHETANWIEVAAVVATALLHLLVSNALDQQGILIALALGARVTEELPRGRALAAVVPCAALVFIVTLLYGGGLRLMECLRLRVRDLDFARHQITLRSAKNLVEGRNARMYAPLRELLQITIIIGNESLKPVGAPATRLNRLFCLICFSP